jgi:hypothetical protein
MTWHDWMPSYVCYAHAQFKHQGPKLIIVDLYFSEQNSSIGVAWETTIFLYLSAYFGLEHPVTLNLCALEGWNHFLWKALPSVRRLSVAVSKDDIRTLLHLDKEWPCQHTTTRKPEEHVFWVRVSAHPQIEDCFEIITIKLNKLTLNSCLWEVSASWVLLQVLCEAWAFGRKRIVVYQHSTCSGPHEVAEITRPQI